MTPFPYWVAGTATTSHDGRARAEDVERAVTRADDVRRAFALLPAHVRADALDHVSRRLAERVDEVAATITAETGKPDRWARAETDRGVATFRWAAEEARRFSGELQRLDTDAASAGRLALVRRAPRGPVLGITPFNFPLNLVAHKLAPALAVGAPIIIKPAPATPRTAALLGELLAETGLPAGSWSILPMTNAAAGELVADPRLPVVSFTGSGPVGWAIRDRVPRKHVTLELGGNAAAIVCPDWTDLEFAARRIATFATYQGGQSCVSVQRVYAHTDVHAELVDRIVTAIGDLDPGADVGPLIDETAARRVSSWIEDAVAAGARLLTGGTRDGATVAPTVLADAPEDSAVCAEEVFGPVLTVAAVASVDEAVARVNASRFGLQAGVFTHDLRVAFHAAAALEVGGVIVGDVPSYRADQLPYGGVKDSGTGREGVRAAMDDLTEPRVLVLTGV